MEAPDPEAGPSLAERLEAAAEAGALYKPEVHRARFKSDARRKAGPAGRRRANI